MTRRTALLGLVILLVIGVGMVPANPCFAKWTAMGSLSGTPYALTVYRGEVVAAGNFLVADGREVNHIARWDGSSWQPLGVGLGYADPLRNDALAWVTSLQVIGDDLFVGGEFTEAGGVEVHYVARWDGTQWSDVAGGVGGQVYSLAEFQGALVVGGSFEATASHTQIYYVAQYRNGGWRPVGEGLSSIVFALEPFGTRLVAGGRFAFTGTRRPINRVAEWDGNVWVGVGADIFSDRTRVPLIPPTVLDLKVVGTDLYAIGIIDEIDSQPYYGLARFTDGRWAHVPLAAGKTQLRLDRGFTLGSYLGDLVIGGVAVSGAPAGGRYLTRFRNGQWEGMGGGVNDFVQALLEHDDSLIVGGNFTKAGGKSYDHIVRWSENTTAAFAPEVRIDDRGEELAFEVRLATARGGELSLRREGPRGSALVDRRSVMDATSVVLRDPSPLAEPSLYWIEWTSEVPANGEVLRAGPYDVAASVRSWSTALRQLPSEGHARFQWTSPRAGHVVVEVFDLRGRRLAALLDEDLGAGPTVFDWDGSDGRGQAVARGRYVLRARQGTTWRTLSTVLRR